MNSILITVRTGSTRLPKKALIEINGKTTIEYLITRVKQSVLADKIILCTTTLEEDDILCHIAQKNNIDYFRGSVEDKLERWRGACEKFNIDFFVTADGDDLFCEPKLIDNAFKQNNINCVDFIKAPDIICGAFTYGIKYSALKKVCEIKDTTDTEMMWTYFEDTGLFNVQNLQNIPKKYKRSDIRMTLDYPDDLKFFTNVINHFGKTKFGLDDIINYINNNVHVAKINLYLEKQWAINQKQNINLKIKK
jgi:spore coat polysaccharide biosynthesis protein SpsF (cytidylyltransferase family)